jgi:predicted GNAT family acetyltransferase
MVKKIMISVTQLQEYLHHSAQQQYETVKIPCFKLYFHPSDRLPHFNYAIPDYPQRGDIVGALTEMQTEFTNRNRRTRLEFIQECSSQLETTLGQNKFNEESKQDLMVCTKDTFRPISKAANLQIEEINEKSDTKSMKHFLTTQRRGFDEKSTKPATEVEALEFLRRLGKGRAFLGWLGDIPVGAGMFSAPHSGISELMGLATLTVNRRQGIGTAITSRATKSAFEAGAGVVFLSAADEKAGQLYQRVGFRKYATMLAYIDADPIVGIGS